MAKKNIFTVLSMLIFVISFFVGCAEQNIAKATQQNLQTESEENIKITNTNNITELENNNFINLTADGVELDAGLSAVRHDGNYGFDKFLEQGGATSDAGLVEYLVKNLLPQMAADMIFSGGLFGCSTIAAKSPEGTAIFGRNFDWQSCEAMIVGSYPDSGYASISTANMDFIGSALGGSLADLPIEIRTLAALYAPLDGMNEQGLTVSVNMIQDSETIEQNTDKPDITTTTAIRMMLNKAATVAEALELLNQYDMHASMGMMIHFAIADAAGDSVVVEYIDNKMQVTQTPVVTNFYLAQGEKYGMGTEQSRQRYDILMERLAQTETMSTEDMRDALDSVSKDDFGEFESTEWSIVFDQAKKEATYYHREDYNKPYSFKIDK